MAHLGDQVSIRVVFERLYKAFAHVSSVEHVWEVCAQDKTPDSPRPQTRAKEEVESLYPPCSVSLLVFYLFILITELQQPLNARVGRRPLTLCQPQHLVDKLWT